MEPTTLNASLLPTSGTLDDFPEIGSEPGRFGPPWAGLCISGGGSRSLSAAMGQLRGLSSIGLLDQFGWLSTVSGGTWASSLFNWAPESITEETLLGPLELDPSKLEWESGVPARNLSILDGHAIGSAATRVGIEEMLATAIDLYLSGTSVGELWPRAIGELVLAPFGLGDSPSRYFTWTPWWLKNAVLKYNRGLGTSDFVTTRPNRPYLITNSTLFYPPDPPARAIRPGAMATGWEVGYEVESTPIGVGIPPGFPLAGPPRPGEPGSSDLGGGWIDAFAMGSVAPQEVDKNRRFTVPVPPSRFRLSDAAGLSSLAFAYDVIDAAHRIGIHYLDDMVPTVQVWPVLNAAQLPRNAARRYLFGDGGNLENQGIMPLLRRRLKKVVAFVNTETQLSQQGPNQEVVVDSDLAALFGLEWDSAKGSYVPISTSSPFRFNRVFDEETFDDLRNQLWARAQVGGTAWAIQKKVKVYKNPHYGVSEGEVDLLWGYLHPVTAWWDDLSDWVKAAVDVEPWNYLYFPNYLTVEQLHLNNHQVNLLAHLTSWNVASTTRVGSLPSNQETLRAFLAS
ncbi:MAG: hypothetical protein K8J08_09265 [Thermoanaerobaculia bacterium]|nr:hypothetical protein [Thermoanaerobaculia bacterium]